MAVIEWDLTGITTKEEFLKLLKDRRLLIEELSELSLTEIQLKADAKVPSNHFSDNFVVRMGVDYIEFNNEYYAYIISVGRAPQEYSPTPSAKMPPIGAMVDFVKKAGIKKDGMTDLQMAFVLQKSIAKKGIKKKPYLAQAWTQIKKKSIEIIDKYIDTILEGAIGVG